MKKIVLEEQEYELIKDYKSGFDIEQLPLRYTD